MTVEILRLCGREIPEAEQAANELLDLRTGPRDLRRLLVLDDTVLLAEHAPLYRRLDTARRVEEMLCVAVGPLGGNGRMLHLPGNLGGTQGSPVLWVGDPIGIHWRVAVAAIAIGHPSGRATGLDHLVELLSVEDMFRRVHRIVSEKVPGRVASPGLRLTGQEDEAATFAAALAAAVHALCRPGSGADGPYREMLPSEADGTALAEDGALARYRDEVVSASEAIANQHGLGARLRRGNTAFQPTVIEAGAALTDLRDLVIGLFRNASTVGELTENQRRLILDAGIRFAPRPQRLSRRSPVAAIGEQPLVYQSVVKAIQGGDTLPLVVRRLTLTERELKRRGSASYLNEVDERCPPPLLERLASPPERLPRRASAAEVRHELGIDDAARAAVGLAKLVLAVAVREWSSVANSRREVSRMRVAVDGVREALNAYAAEADHSGSAARGARLTRLSANLAPTLRDLVFRVLATEAEQPSAGGPEAFGAARERTTSLLAEWVRQVRDKGVTSRPSFATSGAQEVALYASEETVAEIRAAMLTSPSQEMWQLCAPDDLGMLNVSKVPETVRFASRLSQDALSGTLHGDQPVWTSSGSHAGLLRFVSLRSSAVSSSWHEPSSGPESS